MVLFRLREEVSDMVFAVNYLIVDMLSFSVPRISR